LSHLSTDLVVVLRYLHCTLAVVQCIVIGPVCGFVGGSVTTITRNCVHWSSPNWVCRWR